MKQFRKRKYWEWVPVIILGLTPLRWFWKRGGVLINGVDTNFPLDPGVWFMRRFYVWNNVSNGGADFSSSTAGLFFHLIQYLPYKLGLSLQVVQIISLVFWFMLIVGGAFWLARVVVSKRYAAQLTFVVFYAFNIYLFNSWENVKVANLSLVAAIPLAIALITARHEKKVTMARVIGGAGLVGIVVSGTGINPSYFISFLMTILIYQTVLVVFAARDGCLRRTVKDGAIILVVIVLTNLFWMWPTAHYILGNVATRESLSSIGFSDWINSLSEHTSLLNIIRMQGAWDWYAFDGVTGLPLYIPYALNYFYRIPFIVFSFLVPLVVMGSLVVRAGKKVKWYLSFSMMMVVAVFLGTGTNGLTGRLFEWLMRHVPFFSLFRSPWYIFTPMLILAYAGLMGLLIYSIEERLKEKSRLGSRLLAWGLAGILVAGNLFYSYPLITGKIFRPAKSDGFYVRFPEYVFESGNYLEGENTDERIIGYPDDEIEQFRWGYRGVESILSLMSEREVLFAPLNDTGSGMARLVKEFYERLRKGQVASGVGLAKKLGAGLFFEKKDQTSLAAKLPEEIGKIEGTEMGEWVFRDWGEADAKIYPAESLMWVRPYRKGEKIFSVADGDAVLVNPDDSVVGEIGLVSEIAGEIVLAENMQLKDYEEFAGGSTKLASRLMKRNLGKVNYEFENGSDGIYQPMLERYRLGDFGIEEGSDLKVEVDGEEQEWKVEKVDDAYVYYKPREVKKGKHRVVIEVEVDNLVRGGDFESGKTFEEGGYGEGRGEWRILEEEGNGYLEIFNVRKADVTADFGVEKFDPMGIYLIQFRYQQIYGNNALLMAGQNNEKTLIKTQIERLPNYPDWVEFSAYYEPVKTESVMKVILSAPFTNDPLGTRVYYDDLEVNRVFTNRLVLIKKAIKTSSLPKISYDKRSPIEYRAEVTGAMGPQIIVFNENYSKGWELKVMGKGGGDELKIKHFSANIFANAWYIEGAGENYDLEIKYRPQRYFVWGGAVSLAVLAGGGSMAAREYMKRKKSK